MRIAVSTRPRGLKRGVSTDKFYREGLGYSAEHDPDICDVVGRLELSAHSSAETMLLAALFRLFGRYSIGKEAKLAIYDKDGKMLVSYVKETEGTEDENGHSKAHKAAVCGQERRAQV